VYDARRQWRSGLIYDPDNNNWSQLPNASFDSRTFSLGVWVAGRFVLWGGLSDDGTALNLNDGGAWRADDNAWEAIPSPPFLVFAALAPAAERSGYWATDSDRVFVWGGSTAFQPAGGILGVANGQWSEFNAFGAPAPRQEHTAVWTGRYFVVWGGNTSGGAVSDGARYDTRESRWLPVATNGAPAPRYGHVAAWTGTRMVVWGGKDASGQLASDGGAYDPSSDSWDVISTTHAPAPMFRPVRVWTGDRLVVIPGGEVEPGTAEPTAGGIFDASQEKWTRMDPNRAPSEFFANHGVWDGCRVLFVGARRDAAELWAYEPPPLGPL
jgi:hypothetical protein